MPPQVDEVPLPVGRGQDAARWLAAHGLIPQVPALRASAFHDAMEDPFQFYLKHRLGLVPAISTSAALNLGTWMHKILEDITEPEAYRLENFENALRARREEIIQSCRALNLSQSTTDQSVAIEQEEARTVWAWVSAAMEVPIPPRGSVVSVISAPHWRVPIVRETGQPAVEWTIKYNDPRFRNTPLVIKVDRLMYHSAQNSLWVVDWKSCKDTPRERLEYVELTFNTKHYCHVIQKGIESGAIQAALVDVPANCTFGGFIHVAIQKPTIRISMSDRDFRLVDFTPTRGPFRGVTRQDKVYEGEPKFENYLRRVADWYHGRGDYVNLRAQRQEDPPVNMSITRGSFMDSSVVAEYDAQLQNLYRLSTCEAIPSNFPRSGLLWGQLTAPTSYLPFHLAPIVRWPEVMQAQRFIVNHRTAEPGLEF